MRVRTKICGITRFADARAAVDAGVDALGFNFHPASPRYIDPERAGEIVARLPPFVAAVGLFVDLAPAAVREVAARAGVTWLQFQGDESAAACDAAGCRYIKAVRVAGPVDGDALIEQHPGAQAFLLDAFVPGLPGGTGCAFDWSHWPARCDRPLVLAGGLTPDNVGDAILATRPYAVDVCSGVESERPGVKDAEKIVRFLEEVARAGQGL
jgi:phosphoribosylanthranilate isomerase